MKILVIGNGFDLAHELPTKYKDFLDFLSLIEKMSNYNNTIVDFISQQLNKSSVDNHIKQYIQNLISRITNEYERNNDNKFFRFQNLNILVNKSEDKILRELITDLELKGNLWYSHFMKAKSYINEGWIDFESEIFRVVQILDQCKTNGFFNQKDIEDENIKKLLLKVSTQDTTTNKYKIDEENLQKLEEDLNKLIRCLEIFLDDCVDKIDINSALPDIQGIQFNAFDKILSFNYTNTFEKVYGSNLPVLYDFIHGNADVTRNINTNNMVLGIDEYLDSTQASKNTSFIAYKKYFQRIHKETGCNYKDWIPMIQSSTSESELFIFGHSLDVTDKDVLRELIETEGIKTTIFYYNKKVYASQIANLVKVLGVDNLVSRVHGGNRSITFRQQQNPIKKTEQSQISEVAVSGK